MQNQRSDDATELIRSANRPLNHQNMILTALLGLSLHILGQTKREVKAKPLIVIPRISLFHMVCPARSLE